MAIPVGVSSQTKAAQFRVTVAQKTVRNDCFLDLCRKSCWATRPPGQPPISDSQCSVLSGVRHAPLFAADLSIAYIMNVNALAARYIPKTHGGSSVTRTDAPTTARKRPAAMTAPLPPLCLALSLTRSPGKVASLARGRPCLSAVSV